MRFLADESCDYAAVRALRSAGYDVIAVAEVAPRTEDSDILDQALREGRWLLTEDKDFGQLVYAAAHRAFGVILLRFPADARAELGRVVVRRMGERDEPPTAGEAGVAGPWRIVPIPRHGFGRPEPSRGDERGHPCPGIRSPSPP
jgi:predicted nuclease of predicted toxin-antitoxin system